jgi:hypothetical protein
MGEVLEAAQGSYSELKNLNVWVKSNGSMGTFYRSQHELIFAYKRGTAPHLMAFLNGGTVEERVFQTHQQSGAAFGLPAQDR